MTADADSARLAVAQRRGEALELFLKGITPDDIAQRCGYQSADAAVADIRATLKILRERAYDDMDALRAAELARLDGLTARCFEIIESHHPVLYEGEDTGFVDAGPKLAAMKMILSIMERRARLLGLDAPTKIGVSALVKYELVGIDTGALT